MTLARRVGPEELSPELRKLLPDYQKETVVIGESGYVLYPLNEARISKLTTEVAKIAEALFAKDRTSTSIMDVLVGDGGIRNILAEALDLTPKDIEAVTPAQLVHLADVIYRQNLDLTSVLSETARENFKKLLGTLGIRTGRTEAEERLNRVQGILKELVVQHGDSIPAKALVEALEGRPASSKSTPTSPPSMDGPSITSKGDGNVIAQSPEASATTGSGVKVVPTPSGKRVEMTPEALAEAKRRSTSSSVKGAPEGEPTLIGNSAV